MPTIGPTTGMGPICRDERRRAVVLDHPSLNGIDYVEFDHSNRITVHFLKPLVAPLTPDPTDQLNLISILGGTRIVGIHATQVAPVDGHLEIEVNEEGDFSDYQLLIGWQRQGDGEWIHVIPGLDPALSLATLNFKAGCPVDFDCRSAEICPPTPVEEPLIDYLAKDYASFRQLLLDRITQLNPDWLERSPADLGMVLVELMAYAGDRLSYFQDAVDNERFLDTVRQRVSAKRHTRLIDYHMHDGRNAWAFVHVSVENGGFIDQGTKILSRINAPLPKQQQVPGVVILEETVPDQAFETHPVLSRLPVFETTFPLHVYPENNQIFLHSWGNIECCFPRGTTSAHLYSVNENQQANLPVLNVGDYLLLEEVKGPITGASADADPTHRQVVQLVEVQETEDGAYSNLLEDGELQPSENGDVLPLLKVSWRNTDELSFPLCLSTRPPGKNPLLNLSVARGNMVLADHGRTVQEAVDLSQPVPPDEPFRLRLKFAPLTMQCQPDKVQYDSATGKLATERTELICSAKQAKPSISLRVAFATGIELWEAVPDLLDSPPFAQHFVVDLDHSGYGELRFGDGEYGRECAGATSFTTIYRVGNGRSGNIGAEALAHIVQPTGAVDWPLITAIRNPLSARDGADAETIEEVRQIAPAAFRAEQFRAVNEADWVAAARKMPDVAEAVATFRWTGSWYTVFVGIDPRNPEDLITEPGGRTRLAPAFERRARAFLTRYKLAGYDMEILAGQYVPLEIDLHVCAALRHFRGDVVEAVRQALSNRVNTDETYGFFHPDHFTFGQALYISQLYAAVKAVEGVDSLIVTRFQRYGKKESGELQAGVIPIGSWEIARLDNDPNFMENGVLRIDADGGK